ncbi:hypothetical protein POM88_051524 [Heracleum sosnowskyi]|uniref:Uncharacterized protein n=1 Tax=Heracleum sosnowskyi TaxID=360622 RepID=A0AAD8H0T4_9APIA|nr:hypothetical protein POM88_051524 [Heracleum sosnowskyi]
MPLILSTPHLYFASINNPPPPSPVIDNPPPLLKAFKVQVGFGFDCVSHDFEVLFLEYRKIDKKDVDLSEAILVLYMESADAIITFDLHIELFGLILYPSFVHTRKSNVPDGSLVEKELSLWTVVAVSHELVWNKMFTFGSGLEEIDWLFLYSGANQFFGKT